jgi:hypothetical protein
MPQLHSVTFRPTAQVTFTHQEVSLITLMSSQHYDARCKSMSEPYDRANPLPWREAGILVSMKSIMRNPLGEDDPTEGEGYRHYLSWDDLDTMAKTCEGAHFLPDHVQTEGWSIYQKIRDILTELSRLNPTEFVVPQPDSPYLVERTVTDERRWNPAYNRSAVCECGHTYERHFDWADDNYPTGCKYCGCDDFKEAKNERETPDT